MEWKYIYSTQKNNFSLKKTLNSELEHGPAVFIVTRPKFHKYAVSKIINIRQTLFPSIHKRYFNKV